MVQEGSPKGLNLKGFSSDVISLRKDHVTPVFVVTAPYLSPPVSITISSRHQDITEASSVLSLVFPYKSLCISRSLVKTLFMYINNSSADM